MKYPVLKYVDSFDMSIKYVDFFNFFRHVIF